ncbi:MAG: aminopeptidase P family protein [Gammaproteobacteria bacterium]|nr:aminopeptidase P family protein [Gammaproteobacteria bacterium]TVS15409.1 MAG: aminopeptidase P family protein [Gammaproteobacteria bacterium]
MDGRIRRIREQAALRDLDAIVLSNPYDVLYASGYNSILERWWLQEPVSAVIVPTETTKPVMLVIPEANIALLAVMGEQGRPDRADEIRPFELLNFCEVARAEDPHYRLGAIVAAVMEIHGERVRGASQPDLIAAIKLALSDHGIEGGKVAFDDLRVGHYVARGPGALSIEVEDALDSMLLARIVKTPEELAAFRRIGKKADYAVQVAASLLRLGVTWDEFQHDVSNEMIRAGITPVDDGAMLFGGAFSGEFIPELFRTRHDRPLQEGQIVILETLGTCEDYWIDINRTAVIGVPSKAYQQLHDTVRAGYLKMISAMRPGVSTGDLGAIGLAHLRDHGVSAPEKLLVMVHGVGHMPVELPIPYPANGIAGARGFTLQENMVVSVDCLYFGSEHGPCHMENVYIVTADGAECTYQTPLELMGPR